MANVISSAIVNTPPPEMMGDILNRRNKTHHLDHEVSHSGRCLKKLADTQLDGREHDPDVYTRR